MEKQDERDRDTDGVVEMRESEAAICDVAIDPFGDGLKRRQRPAGAQAFDRLAAEERRGISDRPDKTKEIAIVFEPPMRKSSEKQDVVNGGGKEKENPIAPV